MKSHKEDICTDAFQHPVGDAISPNRRSVLLFFENLFNFICCDFPGVDHRRKASSAAADVSLVKEVIGVSANDVVRIAENRRQILDN